MPAPRLVQLEGSRVAVMSRPAEEDGSNEDALLVQQTPRGVLLAVADGVGGLPQGDRAARLALEAISRASVHEDWVVRGMDAAQASVRRLGGACTTLVAAEVSNQRVRFIHCGDAQGIIVGARSHMKLETVSHSPTGFGLAGGFLDEDEALRHETRHLVCNLIGARPLRYEITGPTKLAKRDTIVLASDGLFDNFRVDEVAALARIRPVDLQPLRGGRVLIPVRQAVAAEAGEIHQVDVLHVGARAQMVDEAPEHGGLEFGPGGIVDVGHEWLRFGAAARERDGGMRVTVPNIGNPPAKRETVG